MKSKIIVGLIVLGGIAFIAGFAGVNHADGACGLKADPTCLIWDNCGWVSGSKCHAAYAGRLLSCPGDWDNSTGTPCGWHGIIPPFCILPNGDCGGARPTPCL